MSNTAWRFSGIKFAERLLPGNDYRSFRIMKRERKNPRLLGLITFIHLSIGLALQTNAYGQAEPLPFESSDMNFEQVENRFTGLTESSSASDLYEIVDRSYDSKSTTRECLNKFRKGLPSQLKKRLPYNCTPVLKPRINPTGRLLTASQPIRNTLSIPNDNVLMSDRFFSDNLLRLYSQFTHQGDLILEAGMTNRDGRLLTNRVRYRTRLVKRIGHLLSN
jgi:hypothetical protein